MKININQGSVLLAAGFAGFSSLTHAQLAQNISVDIRSLSLGNAVTADPPGISSIHFNPAGLTQVQGLQTDFNGLMAQFSIKSEFTAPKGYNVFGYSDDPYVCNDDPNDDNRLCSDFKENAVSKLAGAALYLPVLDDFIKLPKGMPLAAATGGVAYRPPGSKAVYGTAVYAPMVAGLYHDKGDIGNFLGETVALERLTYLSPTIAYQVDDNLSVGASVGMSFQAMAMETDLRLPNDLIGVARLVDEEVCGPFKQNPNIVTDILLLGMCNAKEAVGPFKNFGSMTVAMTQTLSPSYNLGILWEPSDDLAFGMVYQSAADINMTGTYTVKNGYGGRELIRAMSSSITGQIVIALLNFPSYMPEEETGLVTMDLTYPAHFQAGVKYKITPDLQINFDVGYTDFEEWKSLDFKFDRPVSALRIARLLAPQATPTSLSLPLGLQSSWSWGIGIEQTVSDRLKLRLGYEPRYSSVPQDKRNTMIPINNAQLFGTGIGYQFDADTTLDLTAAYVRSRDNIPANTSSLGNKTGVNNVIINPYAGMNIQTKTDIFILGMAYRTRW